MYFAGSLLLGRRFFVFWRLNLCPSPAPEYACSERGVVPGQGCDNRFPFHLNDWGIIDNANDTFGGAQDTLFYKLGAWPTIAGNGTFMNGGQSDKRSVW